MTLVETQKSFEEERKRNPPPSEVLRLFKEHMKFLNKHPEEKAKFFIRAGILEKDGKTLAPFYRGEQE